MMNDYDINDVFSLFRDMSVCEAEEILVSSGISLYKNDGELRSSHDIVRDIWQITFGMNGSKRRKLIEAGNKLIESFNEFKSATLSKALDDFLKDFVIKEA